MKPRAEATKKTAKAKTILLRTSKRKGIYCSLFSMTDAACSFDGITAYDFFSTLKRSFNLLFHLLQYSSCLSKPLRPLHKFLFTKNCKKHKYDNEPHSC